MKNGTPRKSSNAAKKEDAQALQKLEELQQDISGDGVRLETENMLPQDVDRNLAFQLRTSMRELNDHYSTSLGKEIREAMDGTTKALQKLSFLIKKVIGAMGFAPFFQNQ